MSRFSSFRDASLPPSLRALLEKTIHAAREIAETAAMEALTALCVGVAKPAKRLGNAQLESRRVLRTHGRRIGDVKLAGGGQGLNRLAEAIAYEHWRRMLFARFLAENGCVGEGVSAMFPRIVGDQAICLKAPLSADRQRELEHLLAKLPAELFTAADAVGWVYQYWQAKRKDQVNASESKIGAAELPAVTQLFTEPYMVDHLLDNTLGAWWAAQRLTEADLATASSEAELRAKAALPGVPLNYLRFVKRPQQTGWSLAADTFQAWPRTPSEITILDPCCGSGNFLVAALHMMASIRMEVEGLTPGEAVDRVLTENLFGLEIDRRCADDAAFALALAAWRFPNLGGCRSLPQLNLACCGEPPDLTSDHGGIAEQMEHAAELGSLLLPSPEMLSFCERVDGTGDDSKLEGTGASAQTADVMLAKGSAEISALGFARAMRILSGPVDGYTLVATNVPYLGRNWHTAALETYADRHFPIARADLATIFIARSFQWLSPGGTVAIVSPQNWLFLKRYKKFRVQLLQQRQWRSCVRLGDGAFDSIGGAVVQAALLILDNTLEEDAPSFFGLDVSERKGALAKDAGLIRDAGYLSTQGEQLSSPDSRVVLSSLQSHQLLADFADAYQGIGTSDNAQFLRTFWELPQVTSEYRYVQSAPTRSDVVSGAHHVLRWEEGAGRYFRHAMALKREGRLGGWKSGGSAWGKEGLAISVTGNLYVSQYLGDLFDTTVGVVIPRDLPLEVETFVRSEQYEPQIRQLDQAMSVTEHTLLKAPFDQKHWRRAAVERYPLGPPKPYSNDPTQWVFHGHPAASDDPLQVAVARLLGYRWPAETDAALNLAADARAWVAQNAKLASLADGDGIVCIPSMGSTPAAAERLLKLLRVAHQSGLDMERTFRQKLERTGSNDPVTLALLQRNWQPTLPSDFQEWMTQLLGKTDDLHSALKTWLRDRFFQRHCQLFHHRPFIWHVWDGLRDGFSALVHYHRLDHDLMKQLITGRLGEWISLQEQQANSDVRGSEGRLVAAERLKEQLEMILVGQSPHDIFVRWKPLAEQPQGWRPDPHDGVRLNIRPFLSVDDIKRKGAGTLRHKPRIHWKKDRGKDVISAPWFDLGPQYAGRPGDRINDHHLSLADKHGANGVSFKE